MPENKNKEKKSSLINFFFKPYTITDNKALQYSGVGIQLAVTILVFLFVGIWLDKELDTKFIFTFLFTFIGFFGGFYSFYLTIKRLSESEEKNSKSGDNTK
ncbi:MAG: AtpZ/AtpI family protein [Ignavibacteria bacterium]|nr:AtpZ/AtpI family protein [Ignavibacteria bacterium]